MGRKITILIVDDSAAVRAALVNSLAALPDSEIVGNSDDVQPAIDAIRASRPDVVILDFQLKSGNAFDVLMPIKNESVKPIVIIFTAFPFEHMKRELFAAGANFVFDKSSEVVALLDTIRHLARTSLSGESKDENS